MTYPQYQITEENYTSLVYDNYTNNLLTSEEEIFEDLAHVKFIRRLIKNYFTKGVINDRLIVNHIIILNNVFETRFVVDLLFYHIDDNQMQIVLKTFLLFLGYVKEDFIPELGIDNEVAKQLRNI